METVNAKTVAAGVAAIALAATGLVVGTQVASDDSSTTAAATPAVMNCNDWPTPLTTGECQAAGTIRYAALTNLQGAIQFCKWKAANPGEWQRLNGYAGTGVTSSNIVTWMGNSIKNELEAYFVTGAPVMTYFLPNGSMVSGIQPNVAPNKCGGKAIAPPVVSGSSSGQTDATVTVETNG